MQTLSDSMTGLKSGRAVSLSLNITNLASGMLPEKRSLLGHLGAESLYRSTMNSQTGILGQSSQLQNYNH